MQSRGYFDSTLMSQLPAALELTMTRPPAGAVTVLLALPSADLTVTVSPPAPCDDVDTLPLPAVTLVDTEPALALPDRLLLPVVPADAFSTLHPLDEPELDETDALVSARAAVSAPTDIEMTITAMTYVVRRICFSPERPVADALPNQERNQLVPRRARIR
ncbi:MAG: hypothetical protein Q8M24_11600 [Pseudolabrys sp.]|nr:hypothetical protein [Pseudolabrys sp.]MDP2296092.1 hypothetical protein [Pseudolabrys sp.]